MGAAVLAFSASRRRAFVAPSGATPPCTSSNALPLLRLQTLHDVLVRSRRGSLPRAYAEKCSTTPLASPGDASLSAQQTWPHASRVALGIAALSPRAGIAHAGRAGRACLLAADPLAAVLRGNERRRIAAHDRTFGTTAPAHCSARTETADRLPASDVRNDAVFWTRRRLPRDSAGLLGCIGTLSEGSELELRAFDLSERRS